MTAAPSFRTFAAAEARYDTFRRPGKGRQDICQWLGPQDDAPYQAGIAELSRIRIADYTFAFDDFLFVLEGGITIRQDDRSVDLGPGEALFIPRGATVTLEVPDRLVWTYVAHTGDTDWSSHANEPGAVEEMGTDGTDAGTPAGIRT